MIERSRRILLLAGSIFLFGSAVASAQPADHLQCHKIRDGQKFRFADVTLTAANPAFQLPGGCQLKGKAKKFCTAAQKTVTSTDAPGSLIGDGQELSPSDYLCYRIRCANTVISDAVATDQFGGRVLGKFKTASELCVPAVAGLVTTTTTTTTTTLPAVRVFVSSTLHSGDLGGAMGALGGDTICQSLADTAGLLGTWMAWLSDTATSPIARFSKTSAYFLVDGTKIADSWLDLANSTLDAAITLDEYGAPGPTANIPGLTGDATYVFTGTDPAGHQAIAGNHCANWSSAVGGGADALRMGSTATTGAGWTRQLAGPHCDGQAPIYCFEQ